MASEYNEPLPFPNNPLFGLGSLAPGTSNGDVLTWNAFTSTWASTPPLVQPAPGILNGDVLTWNAGTSTWVSLPSAAGLPAGITPGDVLTWNGAAWVSAADVAGGISGSGVTAINEITRWADAAHTMIKQSPTLLTDLGEFTDLTPSRFLYADKANSNTMLGHNTQTSMAGGVGNISLGDNSLTSNTSGNTNIAIGANALQTNSTGNANVAIGTNVLLSATGSNNVGIGHQALNNATTGVDNTAIGHNAGLNIIAQTDSIIIGSGADVTPGIGAGFTNGQIVIGSAANTSVHLPLGAIPIFANNAAAIAGGLVAGHLYRSGANPDLLAIVH